MSLISRKVSVHYASISVSAAPSCAENSHYTTCIPACSPTCRYLYGPPHCSDSEGCEQGCACDDGYVLKNAACVPVQKCGCMDSDGSKYHVRGSSDSLHPSSHIQSACSNTRDYFLKVLLLKYGACLRCVTTFSPFSSVTCGTAATALRGVNVRKMMVWVRSTVMTRMSAMEMMSVFQTTRTVITARLQVL